MKNKKPLWVVILIITTISFILLTTDSASKGDKVYPETTNIYVEGSYIVPEAKPTLKAIVVRLESTLNEYQTYAKTLVSANQWNCLNKLWNAESGWQPGRLNTSSYATGIPQALPGTKIYPDFWSMEREWRDGKLYLKYPDWKREINWGVVYIEKRYSNSCNALTFWNRNNWY